MHCTALYCTVQGVIMIVITCHYTPHPSYCGHYLVTRTWSPISPTSGGLPSCHALWYNSYRLSFRTNHKVLRRNFQSSDRALRAGFRSLIQLIVNPRHVVWSLSAHSSTALTYGPLISCWHWLIELWLTARYLTQLIQSRILSALSPTSRILPRQRHKEGREWPVCNNTSNNNAQ